MAALIRHGRIEKDSWKLLESADSALPRDERLIVPLETWRARHAEFLRRRAPLGLLLESWHAPDPIRSDLACFDIVAVRFAQFTDGRGYSLARLLRERHGWRGELRAVGDVQRDQLRYLSRCGFDSFSLRAGEDPSSALAAFGEFSEAYQAAADEPLPLYRRRAA